MSDIYPSVLSLHILFSAIFPYPGSCTIAKSDSFARPGNFIQINYTYSTIPHPHLCGMLLWCVYRNSCPAVTAASQSAALQGNICRDWMHKGSLPFSARPQRPWKCVKPFGCTLPLTTSTVSLGLIECYLLLCHLNKLWEYLVFFCHHLMVS